MASYGRATYGNFVRRWGYGNQAESIAQCEWAGGDVV